MRRKLPYLVCLALLPLCGCDVAVEHYPANDVYAMVVSSSRSTPTERAAEDVAEATELWFGTPNEPRWPDGLGLVDPNQVKRAAGLVSSDIQNQHFGLFNEHCVRCHGVSGGGDGPASQLQNPYPRDFRAGVFKWKSTERSAKPTRADLMATIRNGIPGTGMPAFAQMSDEDADAMVDYLIYLSVRGEFERRLIAAAVDELDYSEERPDALARLNEPMGEDAQAIAEEVLDQIVQSWSEAEANVIAVGSETPNDEASVARGEKLFHGQVANCVGCHGQGGNAESVTTLDYDDWTKEYTTRIAITPTDRESLAPFRAAGAQRPRQIYPRTLTAGVFRGGGDSETLYRRLASGIAGTPMPAVMISDEGSATGLTPEQVWDLVHYVQSLAEVGRD
ncbi:MAG: c-type cytochrome [Planctomycetota bacterium]